MKLDYRKETKRMIFCALISLCAVSSHSTDVSAERERRLPAPFGEQRAFPATSLPKVMVIRLPVGLVGDEKISVPSDSETLAPNSTNTAVHIAAVGPASDVGPYLRARSPLVDSEHLVNRAAFSALAPAIRRPLKADHDARTSERGVMLPEADWIDNTMNNRLDPWKGRLDVDLSKLNSESESFKSAVANANSKCMPARDEETWKWCLQEKTRLDAWRISLFNRGEAHNAELAKFHLESKPYDSRLAALVAKIESWELAVYALIGRIKKALDEEPATETRTCTDDQHEKLKADVNAKCKSGEKRACKGDQNCETLRLNLGSNRACYAARVKIVDECFGGKPNEGHQKAINDALNAINNCLDWIKKRCGGVGVGSAPL